MASHSPASSLRRRVSTFPRIGTTSKSGRAVRSDVARRKLLVPTFAPFEDFVFANGSVEEGIIQHNPYGEEEEGFAAGRPAVHQRINLELDAAGTARTTITNLPRSNAPQEILAELEFRDPNGEVQTVAATAPLWPAHWLVGIKPEAWAASKENLNGKGLG